MKLKEPTKNCKICFKPISSYSLRNIIYKNIELCDDCFNRFDVQFIHYKIDRVKALSIYTYNDEFRTILYQFKGCYDYEIFSVFLGNFTTYFKIVYHDYYMVYMPSNKEDDIKRQFNHVREAFSLLDLPILPILKKNKKYKQSEQHKSKRHEINKVLEVSDLDLVKNKKILIVDDVCTTGHSLKAAVALIKKGRPQKIRILTLAKVVGHY